MIRNAHQANKKLVKEGFPGFINSLVEEKNDLCINWRDRFDEEFKVNPRVNHESYRKSKFYDSHSMSHTLNLGYNVFRKTVPIQIMAVDI